MTLVLYPQSTTTFKDGVITHDIVPQAAGGGKRHITKMYVEGGELVAVSKDHIG